MVMRNEAVHPDTPLCKVRNTGIAMRTFRKHTNSSQDRGFRMGNVPESGSCSSETVEYVEYQPRGSHPW